MSRSAKLLCAAVLTACLGHAGCGNGSEEPRQPLANRVENPELGLAIANLPETFRVADAESSKIALELIEGEGRIEIVTGEPGTSVNLVAAVKAHQEEILAHPGGEYKGGRELVVEHLPGAAFYSRGRYEAEQGPVEETTVFLIHPWGDRELRVVYTYPAGDDSAARLQDQLFPVVEELEGLPAPGADADETAEG